MLPIRFNCKSNPYYLLVAVLEKLRNTIQQKDRYGKKSTTTKALPNQGSGVHGGTVPKSLGGRGVWIPDL
jgi:hypothetical protein